MTGLLVLAAAGAVVGTLTALLVAWFRTESAAMDTDLAAIQLLVDTERAQHHRAGGHVRRGGRGPCLTCGDRGGQ